MYKKDFSVLMSVYRNDNADHFRKAVNSIINQTVSPTEIVLVVDGPVPSEIESIISDFEKSFTHFRVIRFSVNRGFGVACREGVNNCTNELIARMDSDDISVSNRFEKQLACFDDDKELSVVGGSICEFEGDTSNIVGKRVVPLSDKEIKYYLKWRSPMNHMTVMFKKSEVLRAGNYQDWYLNQDFSLWVRMFEAGCKFRNLAEHLVLVRVGKDMYARRGGYRYYKIEKSHFHYMYKKHIINYFQYLVNLLIRFIIQVVLPNNVRGFVFQKLFRKK